jgi:hypothetical protein
VFLDLALCLLFLAPPPLEVGRALLFFFGCEREDVVLDLRAAIAKPQKNGIDLAASSFNFHAAAIRNRQGNLGRALIRVEDMFVPQTCSIEKCGIRRRQSVLE